MDELEERRQSVQQGPALSRLVYTRPQLDRVCVTSATYVALVAVRV